MKLDRAPVFAAFRTILIARTGETFEPNEIKAVDSSFEEIEAKLEAALLAAGWTPPAAAPSQFVLGDKSRAELEPVRKELADCVRLAITLTTIDFRVNQGLRTLAEQKAAVAAGNSRTMKSKHLRQADGTVWAVDLVALEDTDRDGDSEVSWRFEAYGPIAFAMDRAATQLGVAKHVRWGCAWDRVLSDFGGIEAAYMAEAKAYAARHPGSDLLDAPHFEWVA